jgi:hypothetical protein
VLVELGVVVGEQGAAQAAALLVGLYGEVGQVVVRFGVRMGGMHGLVQGLELGEVGSGDRGEAVRIVLRFGQRLVGDAVPDRRCRSVAGGLDVAVFEGVFGDHAEVGAVDPVPGVEVRDQPWCEVAVQERLGQQGRQRG